MDRQKILMIFAGALVAATLLTWFLFAQQHAPKAVRTVKVLAAARELPAGTRLKKTDVIFVSLAEKELPKGAVVAEKEALDRVLLSPVTGNEPLLASRLSVPGSPEGIPATIEHGKRAIAVQVTDASSVAGLILPHSRVDVLFSRTGNPAEASTTTILQDIEVLSMGRVVQVGQTVDPKAPKSPVATLLATPEEVRKLELAKNQGKISLALRNPLDRSTTTDNRSVTLDALDPMVFARAARAKRGLPPPAAGGTPNIGDEAAWRELTGQKPPDIKKEPPKPKYTVDVFRGEKHVQEIFQ